MLVWEGLSCVIDVISCLKLRSSTRTIAACETIQGGLTNIKLKKKNLITLIRRKNEQLQENRPNLLVLSFLQGAIGGVRNPQQYLSCAGKLTVFNIRNTTTSLSARCISTSYAASPYKHVHSSSFTAQRHHSLAQSP